VGVPGKMIFKLGEAGSNITGIVLPGSTLHSPQHLVDNIEKTLTEHSYFNIVKKQ